MPTVNIFYEHDSQQDQLKSLIPETKEFIAELLSNEDIKLGTDEVSVRVVRSSGGGMLAEIEVEVTAHAFRSRVEKQDEICLKIQDFMQKKLSNTTVNIWLLLPELGHSWKD
jgi:hypothetical protein